MSNCEGNIYNIGMGCCQPVLAPIENYYTKYQIDKMLEESGCCITEEEVDAKIESARTEIESEIPSLSGYATEQWVLDKHYISGIDLSDYATLEDIPTSNSAFTNDMGYLVEHQPLKTINGESLVGNGNITISGTDLSDYWTSAQTKDYVDGRIEGISGVTSGDVINIVNESVSGKQDTLSAGTNISINNNVISAVDTTYEAGDGISISGRTISTVTKFQCLTEQEWQEISGNPQPNTYYFIH